MKLVQPTCALEAKGSQSLFSCLTPEQLEKVKQHTCHFFKKGQPIFQEESVPTGVFCISEGLVKVTKLGSNGKEQILRIAKPGDFVGYKSLIKGSRYRASAIAIEDSSICHIPKAIFMELLHENVAFYQQIVHLLCEVIDNAESKLTDIAYKPVRGRIAEALLLLDKAFEDKEQITLTREDLAGLVGTVKETAIRIISEFKHEKLIEINKRSIKIINPDGLVKISHLYD
ncbi:Crp/Fnr family transcriptional regulator [Flammeovirga yaeyamensis]|uniref:Crp/Fnr family transcriptional regulator n=1 Tax=Flammeovirga yaeyamensis TaxID=367791 RepID=A0AAX1N7E7_9BACT|nr:MULTISPECIES: Crp/Fnr family transcriptional regulator [Flammeovirga]ANQ50646.1 Crp/Fnr family transcriptional regulator [Flammeovirga sp. MY04]MBB3700994.1 CRP-like cAMP-binding protein [Flammeovirga yaeyamensis]NMF38172.1 Crp/Fnr family transcriptional regulator [Flammeovirga yaeyamensis]QWG01942.1 Crp/Fnr family transcriptional regulator [Flammeovirga yaeyamensis]